MWTFAGALSQIAATLLLLLAMRDRSFVVVTAYSKTEPVQVAIFGLVLLGDRLTLPLSLAIIVATLGVVLMSWPRQQGGSPFTWRASLYGIASAALFGIAAVCFRGAILTLSESGYVVAATTILALTLLTQTVVFSLFLLLRDPRRAAHGDPRVAAVAAGGPRRGDGFGGVVPAFALESAARVRTLALVEILFAQILAYRLFRQNAGWREWAGIALIVAGVVWLLNG